MQSKLLKKMAMTMQFLSGRSCPRLLNNIQSKQHGHLVADEEVCVDQLLAPFQHVHSIRLLIDHGHRKTSKRLMTLMLWLQDFMEVNQRETVPEWSLPREV